MAPYKAWEKAGTETGFRIQNSGAFGGSGKPNLEGDWLVMARHASA